jgi:phthalate 4,5-dioxygenase oxygenase subunit
MLKPDDHKLLSETTRGTQMGELLRRYWVPAVLSEELRSPGGRQVRVRVLGENLVAFREPSGKVGLVREFCSHRGASLYFGRVEEGGIRCSYHGWKYAADGTCLETPNEPATSTMKTKICHPSYPCVERAGIIWAYLGPKGEQPALPDLEFLLVPESHTFVTKRLQLCHWTQAQEADIDSSHVPFLHGEVLRERIARGSPLARTARWVLGDTAPKIEVVPKPYGFLLGSHRRTEGDERYWRINQWLMPWFTMIPSAGGDGPLAGHAWVPIDDTRTWTYTFTWHPTRPLTEGELVSMRSGNANYAELLPNSYVPRHNRSNDYNAASDFLPDAPPWRRIGTIQEQDMSMIENMGPGALYDRTIEHLGTSDVAVIQVRRRLIASARDPSSRLGQDPSTYRVRQISALLPRSVTSWEAAVKDRIEARPETFTASV